MKTIHLLITGVVTAAVATASGACSDDAAPSTAATTTTSVTSGGGDGGSPGVGGSAGEGGSGGEGCVVDDDCAVSFKDDIHDAWFADADVGSSGSADCHDSDASEGGLTYPADASDAYDALIDFEIKAGGNYIVPCDAEASKILCNMNTEDDNPHDECGELAMPVTLAGAKKVTAEQLEALEDWIACGAPNN